MSIDLYFAGAYNKDIEDVIISENYNKLLSNINDRKMIKKYIDLKKEGKWKGKLFIDSGAFTTHTKGKQVDIEDYIKLLNENHEWIDLYVQVDDIPGKWKVPKTREELEASPPKTWANYLYMRSKLINPYKLLPVFHQGEDFKYLKQMLEYRDENGKPIEYLCVSSNKNLDSGKRYEWYKDCYEIIEQSSNPNIKVHSLGTQSEKHCSLIPFTSADATSWILTAANGNIYSKWGTVYISDRGINEVNHINNGVAKDIFSKYVESKGFTFEELCNNHNKRVEWNLRYLGEWAKNMEYKGPKSFKRTRLF